MYHLSFLSNRNHNLENLIYGHVLDCRQLSNSLEYLCKMRIPPVICTKYAKIERDIYIYTYTLLDDMCRESYSFITTQIRATLL